jgi:hypothetical protein
LTVFERRASAILYRILRAAPPDRPMLMPVNSCPALSDTFLAANRPFEPVDICNPGLGMDKTACIARASRAPIAGVLYVHPYGAIDQDVSRFFADLRAARTGLILIDDRCLCEPAPDGGLTPHADATIYSTGYGKVLDLGEGGFGYLRPGLPYGSLEDLPIKPGWIDLRPPAATDASHRARVHGELPALRMHKARLNEIYRSALAGVALPDGYHDWRFNIRVPRPDHLIKSLFAAGLFAGRHYRPIAGDDAFPIAEALYGSIVNLFNDRHYDESMARRTTEVVLEHVARVSGR